MEVKPYSRNAKKHPKEQVEAIANSIKAFGCKQPLVLKSDGTIIVGHGRYLAMKKLGYKELKEASQSKKGDKFMPYILADDLSDDEIDAYRLADNKLNESPWDMELVEIELERLDIKLQQLTGFDLDALEDETYTKKIKSPIYEPKNEKPDLSDIIETEKVKELQEQIKNSKIPEDEKEFLIKSATRFYEYDYAKIADYYAHSDDEVKDLMEKLALVIIDYDKAIENGFVQLTNFLMSIETDEE
jgi:hypothetical protein